LDSGREASPLRPADDAWILDTSDMTIDEVVSAVAERHLNR
jgi:cytidylate kinase